MLKVTGSKDQAQVHTYFFGGHLIQLISSRSEPRQSLVDFDFTACAMMFYYTSDMEHHLVCNENSRIDAANKILRLHNLSIFQNEGCPKQYATLILRVNKYIEQFKYKPDMTQSHMQSLMNNLNKLLSLAPRKFNAIGDIYPLILHRQNWDKSGIEYIIA